MRVLGLTHGPNLGTGVLGDVVRERGHELDEVDVPGGGLSRLDLDAYGAVLVMGGRQHADQEDSFPWLLDELAALRALTEAGTPWLGVCLGAQVGARALGGSVRPAGAAELGWHEVETTLDAADDALFARLPARFASFQWHYYTYEPPPGAVELARSGANAQAYRVGDRAWGVQFHPEVRREQVARWLVGRTDSAAVDAARFELESGRNIAAWNVFGRELAAAFVDVAERLR